MLPTWANGWPAASAAPLTTEIVPLADVHEDVVGAVGAAQHDVVAGAARLERDPGRRRPPPGATSGVPAAAMTSWPWWMWPGAAGAEAGVRRRRSRTARRPGRRPAVAGSGGGATATERWPRPEAFAVRRRPRPASSKASSVDRRTRRRGARPAPGSTRSGGGRRCGGSRAAAARSGRPRPARSARSARAPCGIGPSTRKANVAGRAAARARRARREKFVATGRERAGRRGEPPNRLPVRQPAAGRRRGGAPGPRAGRGAAGAEPGTASSASAHSRDSRRRMATLSVGRAPAAHQRCTGSCAQQSPHAPRDERRQRGGEAPRRASSRATSCPGATCSTSARSAPALDEAALRAERAALPRRATWAPTRRACSADMERPRRAARRGGLHRRADRPVVRERPLRHAPARPDRRRASPDGDAELVLVGGRPVPRRRRARRRELRDPRRAARRRSTRGSPLPRACGARSRAPDPRRARDASTAPPRRPRRRPPPGSRSCPGRRTGSAAASALELARRALAPTAFEHARGAAVLRARPAAAGRTAAAPRRPRRAFALLDGGHEGEDAGRWLGGIRLPAGAPPPLALRPGHRHGRRRG